MHKSDGLYGIGKSIFLRFVSGGGALSTFPIVIPQGAGFALLAKARIQSIERVCLADALSLDAGIPQHDGTSYFSKSIQIVDIELPFGVCAGVIYEYKLLQNNFSALGFNAFHV